MKNNGRLDLEGWKSFGPCQISLDTQNPLSRALPAVIKVVSTGAGGECGIQNQGRSFPGPSSTVTELDRILGYWSQATNLYGIIPR
jgi:hypothetical protein